MYFLERRVEEFFLGRGTGCLMAHICCASGNIARIWTQNLSKSQLPKNIIFQPYLFRHESMHQKKTHNNTRTRKYMARSLPGTLNSHLLLVVSVGWFQISTWKMVVSPNIPGIYVLSLAMGPFIINLSVFGACVLMCFDLGQRVVNYQGYPWAVSQLKIRHPLGMQMPHH